MEELFGPLAFILIFFVLPRLIRAAGASFFRSKRDAINKHRQQEMDSYHEEKYATEGEGKTVKERAEEARAEEIGVDPAIEEPEKTTYLDEQRVYTEEPLISEDDPSSGQMDPEREWSIDSDSTWGDDWKRELAETKKEAKKQIEKIQQEIEEELETRDEVKRDVVIRKGMELGFSRKNIIQGVIFSELFGPPRARRRRSLRG